MAVFLVDDEAPARARLKELLQDLAAEVPTRVAGEAQDGREAIERIPASGASVAFLDIHMPGPDGLEVARQLSRLPDCPAIVFVTAHDRHAVEAFELNALDYLLKPVRAARLLVALRKAQTAGAPSREALDRAAGNTARTHIPVSERNRIALIATEDVLFMKAEMKYVTLRTREREYLIEEPLTALEKEFAAAFVRIHRNCLVAKRAIRGFERIGIPESDPHWEVVLEGHPERLPVSRRQWSVVRAIVAERSPA